MQTIAGSTMLTVFFNYIGMMTVGLVYAVQSWYADRKQRRLAATAGGGRTHVEYDVLMTEVNEMTETRHNVSLKGKKQREKAGKGHYLAHMKELVSKREKRRMNCKLTESGP